MKSAVLSDLYINSTFKYYDSFGNNFSKTDFINFVKDQKPKQIADNAYNVLNTNNPYYIVNSKNKDLAKNYVNAQMATAKMSANIIKIYQQVSIPILIFGILGFLLLLILTIMRINILPINQKLYLSICFALLILVFVNAFGITYFVISLSSSMVLPVVLKFYSSFIPPIITLFNILGIIGIYYFVKYLFKSRNSHF
jgi:hypothetical protein